MIPLKIIFTLLFTVNWVISFAQITLPKVISNGAIFQRDTELKIWGWAAPNESVKLLFKNKTYTAITDENGDWSIILPSQKYGGPYDMVFKGSNTISLKNILFGDVWICSGQSNMEIPMERVKEKYMDAIKSSENTNIRQFLVPDEYDFKVQRTDLNSGSWESANPESLLNFSAVAYFFAKELYEQYHIPIGLINAALGGSRVECWLDENTLKQFPESYQELQKFKSDRLIDSIKASDKKRMDNWHNKLNEKDKGFANTPNWNETKLDDSNWETMDIPNFWTNTSLGNVNGVVWFRKDITIAKNMVGKTAKLWLGRIVDQDFAYVNGKLVGTTGYQYPPRRYTVNAGILKEGTNSIAVRVINNKDQGGFILDKRYYLAVENDTIDLEGPWKYKLGSMMEPLESQTFIQWKPAGLFNAMINPLLNLKIKGVIWYQGESSANAPDNYNKTFSELIKSWRRHWSQGNFPFIFVQLPNFMEETPDPSESNWAKIRQAQLETLSVENTGMAVAIDLGEWNDLHPLNKYDVGKRLSMQAKKLTYDDDIKSYENPIPKKSTFKKNEIIVSFKHIGNGLITKGNNNLQHFAISNDGIHFEWANAEIQGNKIKVWNNNISNPIVVRYAWANNPKTANLYTVDGLPVSPFEVKKELKK